MNPEKLPTRIIAVVVLAAILFTSLFIVSDVASSPETHAKSIAALDDKKATVVGLTATTAVASIAVSAIPGDATTPIANQIAELSSYLLVVTGILMLEEFLLTLTGYLTFSWLIPAACVLGILYILLQVPYLKRLATRLVLFGIAICLIIPVSIKVSSMFEETFELKDMVSAAEQASENVENASEDEEEQQDQQTGVGSIFSQIGETVTGAISSATDTAKNTLNKFIDAVAVLVISNCVIPVLVMFVFLQLIKAVLPQSFDGAVQKAFNTVQEARSRTTHQHELPGNTNKTPAISGKNDPGT